MTFVANSDFVSEMDRLYYMVSFLLGHTKIFGDEKAKLMRSLCLPLHMHALQRGQSLTILPFSIASQSHGPVGAPLHIILLFLFFHCCVIPKPYPF